MRPRILMPVARARSLGDMYIAELCLSAKTINMLDDVGCLTVDQLVGMTETELARHENVGEHTLKEINKALRDIGQQLKN